MKIAELYEIYKQHPVVATDSRKCPQGALFFALKGDSFNGNAFAAQALEQGCVYAIVDEAEYAVGDDERYILVEDVLATLQQLAHYHRNSGDGDQRKDHDKRTHSVGAFPKVQRIVYAGKFE